MRRRRKEQRLSKVIDEHWEMLWGENNKLPESKCELNLGKKSSAE